MKMSSVALGMLLIASVDAYVARAPGALVGGSRTAIAFQTPPALVAVPTRVNKAAMGLGEAMPAAAEEVCIEGDVV